MDPLMDLLEEFDALRAEVRQTFAALETQRINRRASRPEDTIVAVARLDGQTPPEFPTTVKAFRALRTRQLESHLAFYGIRAPRGRLAQICALASHIGLHALIT